MKQIFTLLSLRGIGHVKILDPPTLWEGKDLFDVVHSLVVPTWKMFCFVKRMHGLQHERGIYFFIRLRGPSPCPPAPWWTKRTVVARLRDTECRSEGA